MTPLPAHPLDDVQCARLPAGALPRLARLRCVTGVEVAFQDDQVWVRWDAENEQAIRELFPIPGGVLFVRRGPAWHAWGQTLPAFDFPQSLEYRPLFQVLFPAPIASPVAYSPGSPSVAAVRLTLVADEVYRPTRGICCSLVDLANWADEVPGCVLEKIQAAIHEPIKPRGEVLRTPRVARAFLLGKSLPWFADSERFWGQRVLVPIGSRPSPVMTEAELRLAMGAGDDDLLILRRDGCEVIAEEKFSPLGHAALRIALSRRSS